MRNANIDGSGVGFGRRNITDLRYADNSVLLLYLWSIIIQRVYTERKKVWLLKNKAMDIHWSKNVKNKVINTNFEFVKKKLNT